jgi:hypothetical protein
LNKLNNGGDFQRGGESGVAAQCDESLTICLRDTTARDSVVENFTICSRNNACIFIVPENDTDSTSALGIL